MGLRARPEDTKVAGPRSIRNVFLLTTQTSTTPMAHQKLDLSGLLEPREEVRGTARIAVIG